MSCNNTDFATNLYAMPLGSELRSPHSSTAKYVRVPGGWVYVEKVVGSHNSAGNYQKEGTTLGITSTLIPFCDEYQK